MLESSNAHQARQLKPFRDALGKLVELSIGHETQDAARKQEILQKFKQLGEAVIRKIIVFTSDPSRKNGYQVFRTFDEITRLTEIAQKLDPKEPAFSNQNPIAQTQHDIKPYTTPYVGAAMNDIFASFALSSTFATYLSYLDHYELNRQARQQRDALRDTPLPKRTVG